MDLRLLKLEQKVAIEITPGVLLKKGYICKECKEKEEERE
jgi:hypothetical protein